MDVDWNYLHQFILIANYGNLTQAARITGISQPTLSRNLKELEGQIGGLLFERLPNQLLLTPLGEEVLEQARAMKGNAESLLDNEQRTIHEKHMPVACQMKDQPATAQNTWDFSTKCSNGSTRAKKGKK